jgi:hypothetical protein
MVGSEFGNLDLENKSLVMNRLPLSTVNESLTWNSSTVLTQSNFLSLAPSFLPSFTYSASAMAQGASAYVNLTDVGIVNGVFIRARIIVYNTNTSPSAYGAYYLEGFGYNATDDRVEAMNFDDSSVSMSIIYGTGLTNASISKITNTQPSIGFTFSQSTNNNVKVFYSYDIFE